MLASVVVCRHYKEKVKMKIKVEELTAEAFLPFGFVGCHIDPETEKIGEVPVEFYRDMVQLDLGGKAVVSFSTCRVEKRELVIDVTEYHTSTGEGVLPLDNDVLIHVGPATADGAGAPLDKMRVFRVAKGTMVVTRPGIWHHAPFTVDENPANVLIVLPERTYANDCVVQEIADPIVIEM